MGVPLKDLLRQIATDGVGAYQDVKVENASFFEAMFEKTNEGHKPREWVIDLLKHDVPMPFANMMDHEVFSVTELDLDLETEATLTTNDKGQVIVDCNLKNGLQEHNSKLKIAMKLRKHEPTEGVEQVRAYLAERLNDNLTLAKRERKADAGQN